MIPLGNCELPLIIPIPKFCMDEVVTEVIPVNWEPSPKYVPNDAVDEDEPLMFPLEVTWPMIVWVSESALPRTVPPVAVRTPPIPTSSVTFKSSVTCTSENLPSWVTVKEPVTIELPDTVMEPDRTLSNCLSAILAIHSLCYPFFLPTTLI